VTAHVKWAPKAKPGFQLPRSRPQKARDQFNGFMSQALLSMASDERVIENTPSLQKLREILERPIP